MRFLVLVSPALDEPAILSREEAIAGREWLHDRFDENVLTQMPEAYVKDDGEPITGGFMIAQVRDRAALDELLDSYPMRHTITYDARGIGDLDTGFDVLLAAIDAQNRVRT